ncbi:MAG: hypothetical protein U0W65_00100 [Bacteroidia bacterium]
MKKITVFIALAAVTFLACEKQKSVTPTSQQQPVTVEQTNNHSTSARQAETSKIRVKFRHTAEPDSRNPSPPPCEEPFWICVIFGGGSIGAEYVFTDQEIKDNIGALKLITIDKHHLKLIPSSNFTDLNGVFRMTEDMPIDPIAAAELGFEKVTFKKGSYIVDPNGGPFGSVIIKIKTKKVGENEEDIAGE